MHASVRENVTLAYVLSNYSYITWCYLL